MRASILVSIAIVLVSNLVSAKGTLGFALGTKKPDGTCKYTADYEADFDAIQSASGSRLVRGYSASDCNAAQQMLPAAKAKGFQVILGVWPDVSSSFNADTAALRAYVPAYINQVYAITVGSETLYRGTFTGAQLLQKINQVKAMFPTIKIGTADSWNKYADGTANAVIQGGVELFLVNAFAYWQGVQIGNATHIYFDDVMQAFAHIQGISSTPDALELWTGETGWPSTGGANYGLAIASTANAKTFYQTGVCGMLSWGFNVFYFEAFDEPWKPTSIGDNGQAADETHWGAMTAARGTKFALTC